MYWHTSFCEKFFYLCGTWGPGRVIKYLIVFEND